MSARTTPTPRGMDPALLVDAIPGGRLLVIGSLPPGGRDLDLAMRRRDVDAVDAALLSHGFVRHGNQYVRFGEGTAQVVDTTVLDDWDLPDREIRALIEQARPLPGMRRLARPAAVHTLLLLAPLSARAGALPAHRRARLHTALEEDPDAWQGAQRRADAWRVTKALSVLRHLAEGSKPSLHDRIDALAQPRLDTGTGWARAATGAARRIAPRPRRGAVVTLSGVDGAGKTSQAVALATALERLGEDPVVVWSRVRYDPLLAGIGRTVKRLLAPWGADRSGTIALAATPEDRDAPAQDGTGEEAPLRPVDVAWAYVCAAVDGYRHLQLCLPGLLRGRVVICDRYTLDTHVHLAERFHAHPRAVRGAAGLARLISPRPLRSFWLDLPSDTAWRRKPDDVDRRRLGEHARAYLELHGSHGVVRLDAQRSSDEIAATVASDLWRARRPSPGRTPPESRLTYADTGGVG